MSTIIKAARFITELDSRRADLTGDRAHKEAIAIQQQIIREQEQQDIYD